MVMNDRGLSWTLSEGNQINDGCSVYACVLQTVQYFPFNNVQRVSGCQTQTMTMKQKVKTTTYATRQNCSLGNFLRVIHIDRSSCCTVWNGKCNANEPLRVSVVTNNRVFEGERLRRGRSKKEGVVLDMVLAWVKGSEELKAMRQMTSSG